MKFSKEVIEQIRSTFLGVIAEAADAEYQQRVWIEGRGPECSDYDEFIDYFFLEGEDIIQNYTDFGISDNQHALLVKLRDSLDGFNSARLKADSTIEYLPGGFVQSPEWQNIMSLAKEVLTAFNYQRNPNSSSP